VGCLANATRLLSGHLPDAASHQRATTLSARRQVKIGTLAIGTFFY